MSVRCRRLLWVLLSLACLARGGTLAAQVILPAFPAGSPGGLSSLGDPTSTIGLTVVNGSSTDAMRKDAAPPLNQAIVPTWTGVHTFVAATIHATSATTGTVAPAITYTGAAHTALTASTERFDVQWNSARTVEWATGALPTQRFHVWHAPTVAFVGASTVTDTCTVCVSGPPIKGANATLTRTHGVLIQAGAVSTATTGYGLSVYAPTGAAANYAIQTIGDMVPDAANTRSLGAASLQYNTIYVRNLTSANSFTVTAPGLIANTSLLTFGTGHDTTPLAAATFRGAVGIGTNVDGKTLTVQPSLGTGLGTRGALVLAAASVAQASGTTTHVAVTHLTLGGGIVVANVPLGLDKVTASGTAPGAGTSKLEVVCGTNAGTAKLIWYAGTSGTPVVIVDNAGTGVTGC